MWLYLALVSGALLGIYYILRKHILNNNNVIKVLFTYSFISWLFISYSFSEAIKVEGHYLLIIFLKSFVIYCSWLLAFNAVKRLPITIASPLSAMGPVFTIMQGIVFLNERLTYTQIIGVILILTSYFFIGKVGSIEVQDIYKNKYLYFIILSMYLSSISALIDKIVLKHCTASQIQFWFMLFLAILYLITIIIMYIRKSEVVHAKFNFSIYIILMSAVLILADRIYFIAVKIPASNISIISPLRNISMVISTVFGGLIFKEKNIKKKFKYVLILVLGIIIMNIK